MLLNAKEVAGMCAGYAVFAVRALSWTVWHVDGMMELCLLLMCEHMHKRTA